MSLLGDTPFLNQLRESTGILTENVANTDTTKIKSGYTPPNITPFAGKLTGAAATRYEIAEEYAKRNGVPIEIALQRANFESIETGIPDSGPRNIQTTGRAGVLETTGKGTSTDFNIERNLNETQKRIEQVKNWQASVSPYGEYKSFTSALASKSPNFKVVKAGQENINEEANYYNELFNHSLDKPQYGDALKNPEKWRVVPTTEIK